MQELFEERLQRPLTPNAGRGDVVLIDQVQPIAGAELQVDAEMVVYGVTQPGMLVTLQGEPVTVRPDGTFRVRVDLPNKRQVLPIVTSTPEGVERQTVVLAVERNTKTMEPVGNEAED